MNATYKAIELSGPGKFSGATKPLLDPSPNQVRIRVEACGVWHSDAATVEGLFPIDWPRVPGQLPSQLIAPEVIEGDTFYFEGEELKVVELGHTDTSHTTALYVPSIGLVISGDGVYNNTHLYLAECDEEGRNAWLRALDKIESLHPKAVVTGHGVLDPDSSPRHIEETRRYLRDFIASLASTSTGIEMYERKLSLHPNRLNPGSLWAAAKASKPS